MLNATIATISKRYQYKVPKSIKRYEKVSKFILIMPSKQVQAMTKEQCSTLQCHVMFLVPRPSGNPGALPRDFGIIVIIVIFIVNAIITIIIIIIFINTIIDVILINVTNAIIFISFWTASYKIFSGIPLTLFGIPDTVIGVFDRIWAYLGV